MSYAGLIGFCKKHFLTEKLRLYFKNDLTVNTFTQHICLFKINMPQFLKITAVLCKKVNNFCSL